MPENQLTVGELLSLLAELKRDKVITNASRVILSRDEEGNGFNTLGGWSAQRPSNFVEQPSTGELVQMAKPAYWNKPKDITLWPGIEPAPGYED